MPEIHGLETCILRWNIDLHPNPTEALRRTWKSNDAKIKLIILINMHEKLLQHIREASTAYDMWSILEQVMGYEYPAYEASMNGSR